MTRPLLFAAFAAALSVCACGSGNANQSCNGLEAIASAPQSAAKRSTVTLTGSAAKSSGAVSYTWRLDAPAGSNAVLSSTSVASPTFVPDVGGEYFATLFVRDACSTSAPSMAAITVVNHAPVASGGPDRQAMPGDRVTLDGSGSTDSDQDAIGYDWSLISRPPGSNATLSGATTSSPTFRPDAFGTYVALLVVSDGEDISEPVEVVVKVGITGPNGTCAPAAPPVANAGPDQTNLGPFSSAPLDGTGSTTGRPGPLTFHWTLTSSPRDTTAFIDHPDAVKAVLFPLDKRGTYGVTLVVNDGCVDSAPATVHITRPNSPPQAVFINTPFPQPVPLLAPFSLFAFAFDTDNDPLTYQWGIVSRPAGSTAALSNTASPSPTFAPDVVGTYTFSLAVSDGMASSNPVQASVTVADLPPVARVGPDQAVMVGSLVTLDGTGSSDPSLQQLTFSWTLLRPTGSNAALSDAAASKPTFMPDVPGVYRAQLTVAATRGEQSQPANVNIGAWPPVTRFTHKVTDAAYSKALDRVLMVASDQSTLYLLDSQGTETTLALPELATSVGLDPSGHFAAVGHADAISLINLDIPAVLQTSPVLGEIASVILGNNHDFAFAFQNGPVTDHARLLALPLATGTASMAISGQIGAGRGRYRAASSTVYVTANPGQFGFSVLEEYVLANGLLQQHAIPPGAGGASCGDLWLSESGNQLFTRCGSVFTASAVSTDLSTLGILARPQNVTLSLRHLSDSTVAGEISAIASNDDNFFLPPDDRTLRRWAATDFAARDSIPFPTETAGSIVSHWLGRFVFYNPDGTKRYVILQVDPTSGAAADYGFVIF